MIEIRFHGRGGQGAVTASRILATAAFLEGKHSQSIPMYRTERLEYAKGINGFKLLHIQSSCPTGWGFESSQTIKIAKLMTDTGLWPLYEIDDGVLCLSYKPKELKPVHEALKPQRRFRHLTDDEMNEYQEMASKNWEDLLKLDGKPLPI